MQKQTQGETQDELAVKPSLGEPFRYGSLTTFETCMRSRTSARFLTVVTPTSRSSVTRALPTTDAFLLQPIEGEYKSSGVIRSNTQHAVSLAQV